MLILPFEQQVEKPVLRAFPHFAEPVCGGQYNGRGTCHAW